jgi:hypothetical protein
MAKQNENSCSCVAVLTGDIVGSSKLDAERRISLYKTFPILSEILLKQYHDSISFKISNFRGDGWQLIVNSPSKAFEISLFIRTFIRYKFQLEKLDTRIAIGIGPVQFIPEDNVSAGDGPAYLSSGHLLESFSNQYMGICFSSVQKNILLSSLENMVSLLDLIITSWGPGQSQAVNLALQGFNQTEIANNWHPNPIKQPSVSKSLQTAGWDQVKSSLTLFETLINSQTRVEGEN